MAGQSQPQGGHRAPAGPGRMQDGAPRRWGRASGLADATLLPSSSPRALASNACLVSRTHTLVTCVPAHPQQSPCLSFAPDSMLHRPCKARPPLKPSSCGRRVNPSFPAPQPWAPGGCFCFLSEAFAEAVPSVWNTPVSCQPPPRLHDVHPRLLSSHGHQLTPE